MSRPRPAHCAVIILATLFASSCGAPRPRSDAATRDVLLPFLAARDRFIADVSRREGYEMPAAYQRVLRAVHDGDLAACSNAVAAATGQNDKPDKGAAPLQRELWQYVLEMYGAFEQFRIWTPDLLTLYAHDMADCITSNAIYFGGTDPGRFVLTAFREVEKRPFFVVTQNALADNSYIAYLRQLHGESIWIPSADDSNRAFQQYVQDIQAGRIPAGAEVSIENGRVSVRGVQGVMAINGLLARLIFDRNKAQHDFYVEESYVIPWMYPHLEPQGLLMKLNPEPLEALDPVVVRADRDYWAAYTEKLLAMPSFNADVAARKTFSKLRSAIAGLYVYRRLFEEAEEAFQQARRLYPASPEAGFRLADLYIQQERYDDAKAVVQDLQKRDPDKPDMLRRFLEQIDAMAAKKGQHRL